MSLHKYPSYRDSGVEWLGEVPHHWHVHRLKTQMALRTEKTERRDNPVALENIESWSGRFIATGTEFEGEGIAFEGGDLLFGKLRPYLAKVYLTETSGEAVGDFHVLRPSNSLNARYAQYQMLSRSFIASIDGSTFGSKMPRANWESLGRMPFVVPPREEQALVAAFLDDEIAKIDALIAKQEELVDLLTEKRRAVISQTVTRGLNPKAEMKDTSVTWLGLIPAHWQTGSLTRISERVVVGIAEAATHAYRRHGVPILRSTNIRPGRLTGDILYIDSEFAAERGSKLISKGDLVTVRTGNAGVTAVVPSELDQCQCFTMLITTLRQDCDPAYYCYWMNSEAAVRYFRLEGWGTAQVNISVPILKSLPVVIPPLREQAAIVAHLDAETAKVDKLIGAVERTTSLLRERRSALIATAVTGHIDLRDATPGLPAPEKLAA
jgi:type I restriction enzyme S subunit